jgi:nitric oxide dioxygenase
MLSEFARAYINASVPVLSERSLIITHIFNRNLFKTYPEIKHAFNVECKTLGIQQLPLALILFAYAANIDRADKFLPIIRRIAHKYSSWGISADDYPIIANFLLDAIKESLGYAATTHLLAAWAEAFGLFTNALVQEGVKFKRELSANQVEMENMNVI